MGGCGHGRVTGRRGGIGRVAGGRGGGVREVGCGRVAGGKGGDVREVGCGRGVREGVCVGMCGEGCIYEGKCGRRMCVGGG